MQQRETDAEEHTRLQVGIRGYETVCGQLRRAALIRCAQFAIARENQIQHAAFGACRIDLANQVNDVGRQQWRSMRVAAPQHTVVGLNRGFDEHMRNCAGGRFERQGKAVASGRTQNETTTAMLFDKRLQTFKQTVGSNLLHTLVNEWQRVLALVANKTTIKRPALQCFRACAWARRRTRAAVEGQRSLCIDLTTLAAAHMRFRFGVFKMSTCQQSESY